jgi:hypothetical protein
MREEVDNAQSELANCPPARKGSQAAGCTTQAFIRAMRAEFVKRPASIIPAESTTVEERA